MKIKQKKDLKLEQTLPFILLITGITGILASFILTYDKIKVLSDANYEPSCNINPILSCGSVMSTQQATLLGIPNTIFGLVAFSMLITFSVLLVSGANFKKWVWQFAQLAALAGVIFMHYLFFQGVYRINAICPWCFVVWIITIPTFLYITIYNLQQNNLPVPKKLYGLSMFIQKNHANILLVWYLIIFIILLNHFWYYWSTLI